MKRFLSYALSALVLSLSVNAGAGIVGPVYDPTNVVISGGTITGTTVTLQSGAVTASKLDGAQAGTAPVFGIRAFATWNPATTGTYSPTLPSGNVASITKNGTGDFSITFTTAMPDAEYVVVFADVTDAITLGIGQTLTSEMYEVISRTTTVARVQFYSYVGSTNTASAYDPTVRAHMIVIR